VQLVHLSEKLRIICARYSMTQETLGKELGIAHTTVGRWLKGSSRPYDRHIIRLGEMFSIPVADLIEDSRSLPKHITDGRDKILKQAAAAASARHPDNSAAGQEAFEALAAAGLWQVTARDTVAALRKQAEGLLELAERLERTIQASPVRFSAEAELAELTRQAEENLASKPVVVPKRAASGGGRKAP